MKRKIALGLLLSTLAVTGLALGGDSGSRLSDYCDPSSCPVGCEPCPMPCDQPCSPDAAAACTADAGAAMSCSMSR